MALERFEPGNARQLRHVQRPRAHAEKLRGEFDRRGSYVMRQRECSASHASSVTSVWNNALSYRPNLPADALALLQDFRRVRVFFGWSCGRFLRAAA